MAVHLSAITGVPPNTYVINFSLAQVSISQTEFLSLLGQQFVF